MEFFGTMAGAWSDLGNTVGDLKGQKFRIWYHRNENDGRLIIPTDFDFMCVRLNASGGGTDNDEWVARDFVAHIQAVDNTAPGLFGGQYYWEYITVDDMPHNRGNNFYISVPFDENVYATGTPTISTTWGEATYICGSGTNVLAFMGTIDASAGTTLQITGFDGTVQDLSGNLFTGSLNMTFAGVTSSENYTLDVFHSPSSNVYNIGTKNDLKNLRGNHAGGLQLS